MIKNDGISFQNNVVTTYDYNVSGQSTGVLYSRPRYVQIIRNDVIKQFGINPGTNHTGTILEING